MMHGAVAEPRPERTDWVDVAKAMCIVLVVMMHSTLGYQKALGETGFLDPVVAFFAPFRIPTFFVLSGLFLAKALRADFSSFADKRLLHFGYFYLLWLLIQVVVKDGPGLAGHPGAMASVLLKALIEPYGTLWFLHLLAAFSLAAYACRRLNPLLPFAAAAALHLSHAPTGHTFVDEFAGRAVFFAAGWALAPIFFAAARLARRHPIATALGIAGFGSINAALVFLTQAAAWPPVSLALGLAGALAMTGAAVRLAAMPALGQMLAALGRQTLVVYVGFVLPMAALRIALANAEWLSGDPIAVGLGSAAITLGAILLPLAAARAVHGTPLGFLFHRPRFLRLTAQPASASGPALSRA
jgi:uncharacterized membrane protein YcfT